MALVALLLFVSVALQGAFAGDADSKAKLIADHKTYQKLVEPDNVHVQIGMTYMCGQFDTETHKLTSRVFERYSWNDSRLAWKPDSYGGVTKIHIPADKIWTPEIRLLNAVGASEERDDVSVVILNTGTVYWIVPATYKTFCTGNDDDSDHTYHCRIRLGPWVSDIDTVPLELFSGGFDTKLDINACPYVPTNHHAEIHTKKYECCPKEYQNLDVKFDLKHRTHEEQEAEDDDQPDRLARFRKRKEEKRGCVWPKC